MDDLWMWVSVSAAVIASFELLLLNRRRRLLLLDPRRRRFFVHHLHPGAGHQLRLPRENVLPARAARDDSRPAAPRRPEVALLYADSEGRCAAANEATRRLLHWHDKEGRLSDVLSGVGEDITLLLDRITREAVVERYPAVLGGGSALPVEISAIALRDRDSNFWGAALFVRMRDSNVTLADSAAVPSPR